VVLQSSTEATPKLYVSKQSVSDARYSIRYGNGEWEKVPQEEFREP